MGDVHGGSDSVVVLPPDDPDVGGAGQRANGEGVPGRRSPLSRLPVAAMALAAIVVVGAGSGVGWLAVLRSSGGLVALGFIVLAVGAVSVGGGLWVARSDDATRVRLRVGEVVTDVGVALMTGAVVGLAFFAAQYAAEESRFAREQILEDGRIDREQQFENERNVQEIRRDNVRFVREVVTQASGPTKPFAGLDLRDAELPGLDLSGANLSAADLSGADLSGANLSGANLTGTNMSGANMSAANLSRTEMGSADLTEAIVHDADLTNAYMNAVYVGGADFTGANLTGTRVDPMACDPPPRWPDGYEPPRCITPAGLPDTSQQPG